MPPKLNLSVYVVFLLCVCVLCSSVCQLRAFSAAGPQQLFGAAPFEYAASIVLKIIT